MTHETRAKISSLQQAIWKLRDAKVLVREALGDSDSAQITINEIDELMEDLDADIVCLTEGVL